MIRVPAPVSSAPAQAAYVGRFAPSPSGPLHAGSLVAALASLLDARAHGGRWLVRIEDLDPPREVPGATRAILETLERFGFAHDGPIEYQSRRGALYAQAMRRLEAIGAVYACACTRREVADSILRAGASLQRHGELVYPGTCRAGLAPGRAPRAWRVRVGDAVIEWEDRAGTRFTDALASEVGDFVLRRADSLWAYQLAVVVDDALQGVTDVVRGADLLPSTARQIFLQRLLGLPTPRYLHLPVVTDAHGEKLSKQTGATAVGGADPVGELNRALRHLGIEEVRAGNVAQFWPAAVERWRRSRWFDGARVPAAGA